MPDQNHYHLIPLSENVEENIKRLEIEFGNSDDLSIRRLSVATKNVAILHIEGIVDEQSINENVISPIIQLHKETPSFKTVNDIADKMVQIISVPSIKFILDWSELLDSILAGNTVIFIDDSSKAITLGTKKIQSRSITEPTTQTVIKGPKDSFTENLSTNISLVRSRIQNTKLRLKSTKVSNYSVGGIILLTSIMIAPSYQSHLDEGLQIVPYMLHIPLQIVIPLLLLFTVLIKGKIKNVMN
ncbi:spore germination protein [Bacillus sp. 7884-1]|uniref:spore germination protein n=1 Tax=Bacillus sp. 7884-1 TaxID=2021693 RepID=UPI000BA6D9A0|nr:spore germination protein [Bacillus sp. 7884-1]PAE42494.1 hypothetical protein CHI06_11135 [Bacillus sp. 7884-1]